MTDKRYKVGDKVWWAHCGNREVKKKCLICFSNKKVVLILGDDSRVTLPCDYCGHGFEPPTGFTTEYEYISTAECVIIDSVRISEDQKGSEREYRCEYYYLDPADIFDTEQEAIIRCEVKAQELAHEQATRIEHIKEDVKKSFSWNAGYHLRRVKFNEKQADYHRTKAVLCKAKSKN